MTILISLSLFILGAALGSFAVASAWRLRARQLAYDQAHHETLTAQEKQELRSLRPLLGRTLARDRSQCLHCGYQLTAVDLIPVISWLMLHGKCRKCRQPIGVLEFACELGLGLALALSYAVWSYALTSVAGVALFGLWVVILLLLTIHLAYDARWFLLLDTITLTLGAAALAFVAVRWHMSPVPLQILLPMTALALLALPGLYWLMYMVSAGKWIGLGDVKLLVPLAIMLADWRQAILMLFLANLFGCIWIIPGMLSGKLSRTARVPFGPFLILAWVVCMLCGTAIVQWYAGNLVVL
jgi:leader peptidase (prepilin peptidase)/N-methyltransferase